MVGLEEGRSGGFLLFAHYVNFLHDRGEVENRWKMLILEMGTALWGGTYQTRNSGSPFRKGGGLD